MEYRDYTESCCPFDASEYTGAPDGSPCPEALPVKEIIEELDGLYARGREDRAEAFLEHWQRKARELGDWRAELTLTSELLGQYRRSGSREPGLEVVEKAMALIRGHRLGETLSGATIMLNAATTMKCFGLAAESIPVFRHVCRVYSAKLDPADYRFAGLYNNMALSYGDLGEAGEAERYFRLALRVMEKCRNPENDMAVTLCNMAELYDRADHEDGRIGQCMERAWELLNAPELPRDGYHAFTASKCAASFDYFGYFLYSMELKERADKIYEGT